MGSHSKHQERVKDRISELPDSLLGHIVSFLATKSAVRTSILSTRWKNIWTNVFNLDFCDENKTDKTGFMAFVDRVLSSRNPSDIRKFSLYCSRVDDVPRVCSWIHTAIGHNVVEVDIYLALKGRHRTQRYQFPESLFLCKTLVKLNLASKYITYDPPAGSFPSLRLLSVRIYHPDNDSMEKLFSCGPVLEELTITADFGNKVLNFKVSLPELKKLHVSLFNAFRGQNRYLNERDSEDESEQCIDVYNFCINAPKLEYLDVHADVLSNFVLENAESLVKAKIDLYNHAASTRPAFANCATALLAAVSNVNDLSLSAHCFKACYLPTFDNVSKLELVFQDCNHLVSLFPEFLIRSPNLESLVLDHFDYTCGEHTNNCRWIQPAVVPKCLLSCLQSITMKGFRGAPGEMQMAKYLLLQGKVLKSMTISTTSDRDLLSLYTTEKSLQKQFPTFQKSSNTCQVIVTKDKVSRHLNYPF